MSYIPISHDAFARTTLLRRPQYRRGECAWCGAKARDKRNQVLYNYAVAHDDNPGNPVWEYEAFCNLRCRKAYY